MDFLEIGTTIEGWQKLELIVVELNDLSFMKIAQWWQTVTC